TLDVEPLATEALQSAQPEASHQFVLAPYQERLGGVYLAQERIQLYPLPSRKVYKVLHQAFAAIGQVAVPPVDGAIRGRLGPFAVLLPQPKEAAALGRKRQLRPLVRLRGESQRRLLVLLLL